MKKSLTATLFILSSVFFLIAPVQAAQLFTTTIYNTTTEQVRDVSISYMMEHNFAIDRVEDYTITFTKGFGDGFWTASRNMIVKFNVLQTEENVKLMVTQFEDSPQAWIKGQRAIEHLIPLIQEIRHSIDGTPLDQIVNEAKVSGKGDNESTSQEIYRDSGLRFSENIITNVAKDSIADKAGLQVGDVIIEVNARPAQGDIKKGIDQALLAGRSVVITYERSGEKDVLTLKQN